MAQTLTLGALREAIGKNLGEEFTNSTFTSIPSNTAIDLNRNDLDGTWNQGWLQDVSSTGQPIVQVQNWTQSVNQFTFYRNIATLDATVAQGDTYEVHKVLNFGELQAAVNRGLSLCGQGLRTLVRDETQVFVASVYQYTPNYNTALPNAFFPQGVVKMEVQYDLGVPTAPWIEVTGWDYLDDFTIQVSYYDADNFAGNPIRFTGYGPIVGRVTTNNPNFVIGTFTDDFMIDALIWACTHHAWMMAAVKKSTNENQAELQNAQYALSEFEACKKNWYRGAMIKRRVRTPTGVGWINRVGR